MTAVPVPARTANDVLDEIADEIADHMSELAFGIDDGNVSTIGDLPNPYEVLGKIAALVRRHRVLVAP